MMKKPLERQHRAKEEVLEKVLKGHAMESYIEHRTKEMKACIFCDSIGYKKRPMRQVGNKWICISCWKQLRETIDSLDRWEEEILLREEMERVIKKGLGGPSQ